MSVVLGGYSRGSYAVEWTMHKNFVEDCNTNEAEADCGPARGDERIKGAILFGPNPGGWDGVRRGTTWRRPRCVRNSAPRTGSTEM